ncbi:MAG: HAMP domain-containing sensor histidine kinase [Campylobacterota bacterium]|nr:HAMP domain-containing sensor histidine kinase [Campylobacterota bacterium]
MSANYKGELKLNEYIKTLLYFSFAYLIIVFSISGFHFNILEEKQKSLQMVQNQLSGVDYLKSIQELSMTEAYYQENSKQHTDEIIKSIEKIYQIQNRYPLFRNQPFNNQLSFIEKNRLSVDNYYDFFDTINHENYRIGDVAELHFFDDREKYFLGTMITHYLPEFSISIAICHNIMEHYHKDKKINNTMKSIFIENLKLIYLSADEVEGIIKLLSQHHHSSTLSSLIEKVKKRLGQLNFDREQFISSAISEDAIMAYLENLHLLLLLSSELNIENSKQLTKALEIKEDALNSKMIFYKWEWGLLMLLVSFLFYYFYITYRSNIEKDEEIYKRQKDLEEFNHTLQERIEEEVSKNRAKDQQIFQQSRLAQMGEMISMIAHQWRQPLSAISATSSALELKTELGMMTDEIIIEQTQIISRITQHLSQTIDDFRNFFKSSKQKNMTSYSKIIDAVMDITKTGIVNNNIQIIEKLENKEEFENYDREIQQVVLNLIKNAEDILLGKKTLSPTITLKSYKDEDYIILEVIDNAGGVPKDIIDNIFDPYFSTKSEKNGTGLGLYMSKQIIEDHCNGKLEAINEKNGAIFRISLPRKIKNAEK